MKKSSTLAAIIAMSVSLWGCEGNEPVAIIGGDAISKAQFEAYLTLKRIPLDNLKKKQRTLTHYVERGALATAIEQSNSTVDAHLLDEEVNEFKRQRLISRYFENYLKEAVTPEGIRNYYSQHTDNYQSKQANVAHILFRVTPTMTETQRQAVLTTAHQAYSKITSGTDFDDVAKSISEDTVSGKKGGSLGWITEGAVAPQFSEKVFSMKPGAISEPFLTSFGFHIVKLIDGPQIVKKPLEAVAGDIRYQLKSEAKVAEQQRLLKSIQYQINE